MAKTIGNIYPVYIYIYIYPKDYGENDGNI